MKFIERIEELEQMVKNIRNEYQKLKKETNLVQGGKMDDKLKLIYKKIDELIRFIKSHLG